MSWKWVVLALGLSHTKCIRIALFFNLVLRDDGGECLCPLSRFSVVLAFGAPDESECVGPHFEDEVDAVAGSEFSCGAWDVHIIDARATSSIPTPRIMLLYSNVFEFPICKALQ